MLNQYRPASIRVMLTVADGEATTSDEVQFTAALPNVAPNANAGPDGKGVVGQPVKLDGSQSSDPDQSPQPLSYRWQFVYVPEGSQLTTAAIMDANAATATFVPDGAGQYVLRLEVSDGAGNAADNILIEVTAAATSEQKPQPVVVKGKSKGGGGSFGPLDLLLVALGLAILLRRSCRRRGLLILLLAVIAWPAHANPSGWYLGAGIGRASTNTNAGEVEDRLADRGYTADVHLDDDDNIGWKLLGGYRGGDYWGIEAAYVDLGKVTTQTTAQTTTPRNLVAAVAKVHPTTVNGLSLGPVAYWPLGEQFSLTATAGLFIWKADSKAHLYTDNGTLTVHDSKNGTDWTAGAGANFNPVPAITLRAAWDHYKTDQDTHQLWSVQMVYWFGKSLSSAP